VFCLDQFLSSAGSDYAPSDDPSPRRIADSRAFRIKAVLEAEGVEERVAASFRDRMLLRRHHQPGRMAMGAQAIYPP